MKYPVETQVDIFNGSFLILYNTIIKQAGKILKIFFLEIENRIHYTCISCLYIFPVPIYIC